VRKPGYRVNAIGSLLDEPSVSARRMLQACISTTMSFWVDDRSTIHADLPENIPPTAESLIVGTYGVGTPVENIEGDLRAERRERARSWIPD
jgi:hypothetical protein